MHQRAIPQELLIFPEFCSILNFMDNLLGDVFYKESPVQTA